jgi:hypothetical protein
MGPAAAGNTPDPPSPGPTGGLTPTGGKVAAVDVAAVDVVVSGNGLKGKPGRHRAEVPVMCWWQSALGPSTDPAAMLAAYDNGSLGAQTYQAYSGVSWVFWSASAAGVATSIVAATREDFVAATREPAGSVAWYMAVCRDGATPADYFDFVGSSAIGIRYRAWPTARPPAARVAPIDLAVYANSLLDLPDPVAEHNPKIVKAGGATLVGLATWFWVTDPAAAGMPDGRRSVTARAGRVQATVTAAILEVDISSQAGRAACTRQRAVTPYTPRTSETSACTLVFTKASVDHPKGWPVTVTANWHLTWTGSGNTGADLGTQSHNWSTHVPVAEVQTIVTSAG